LFVIVAMFGIVTLEVVVVPAIKSNVYPIIIDNLPSAEQADLTSRIDFIFFTLRMVPYIMMLGLVAYAIVAIYRREEVPVQ